MLLRGMNQLLANWIKIRSQLRIFYYTSFVEAISQGKDKATK